MVLLPENGGIFAEAVGVIVVLRCDHDKGAGGCRLGGICKCIVLTVVGPIVDGLFANCAVFVVLAHVCRIQLWWMVGEMVWSCHGVC